MFLQVGEKIKQWLSQGTKERNQDQASELGAGDTYNLFGNFRKYFKGIKD